MVLTMLLKPTGIRFAISASILFVVAGCAANAENSINASLDTDFQLRVGQSGLVSEAKLTVKFLRVTLASRCGTGEVCFQEGDGVVHIWLQRDGQDKDERELHTASHESNITDYAGYRIRLVALNPARMSGAVIAPEDYIAILRISVGESAQ